MADAQGEAEAEAEGVPAAAGVVFSDAGTVLSDAGVVFSAAGTVFSTVFSIVTVRAGGLLGAACSPSPLPMRPKMYPKNSPKSSPTASVSKNALAGPDTPLAGLPRLLPIILSPPVVSSVLLSGSPEPPNPGVAPPCTSYTPYGPGPQGGWDHKRVAAFRWVLPVSYVKARVARSSAYIRTATQDRQAWKNRPLILGGGMKGERLNLSPLYFWGSPERIPQMSDLWRGKKEQTRRPPPKLRRDY